MKWLKKSANKAKKLRDSWSVNGIQVFKKDNLPEGFSLDVVVEFIESKVPRHLTRTIDVVYIGEFEEMDRRDINAFFQDGAIFVTSRQDNEMDMIDDIVHEMAHAVEKQFHDIVYGDGSLESEFLAKRERLFSALTAEGYKLSPVFKVKAEYDKAIDEFLYQEIGYEKLNALVNGLFVSAYASTSLSEYFARGFEEFFIGDRKYLKKTSFVLYRVLEFLNNTEDQ